MQKCVQELNKQVREGGGEGATLNAALYVETAR